MLTDVPALTSFNQRFRQVDYYYDLISGKVNEVHYQPKRGDRFFHRYTYDSDNRLITAETSRDYMLWERDAKYYYYPHGPLKRVETGHRKVQGSDYFYTLHGWLKGVNSGALNETYDAGRDGDINLSLNPHAMVARDAYGFTLDYYDSHNGSPGDYTPVGSGMNHIPVMGGEFAGAILEDGLFNGNIVRMGTALLKPDETRLDVLGKAYRYDQLNRICVDTSFLTGNLHAGNSWSGVSGSMAFYGRYSYDANGNILGLKRHNAAGTLIDDFTYTYQSKPAPASLSQYNYVGPQNRLDNVADPATGGMDGQSAGNYAYDEIGNLVKDETEEIAEIKWTVYGKVRAVVREAGSTKPDLDFAYTASGQRYLKVVKPKNPDGSLKNSGFWTFTYYQHDAQGNVLAVYDIKNADEECGYEMYLDQLVLYGSSRLGVLNQKLKMGTMEHSFPGYGGPGMYVCLDELELDDDLMLGAVPATSPGEIFDQSPGGKIEGAKPWELVQNPATVKPLTVFGVTNPPINVAGPAKEETKYEPGHKQYEFSNHLGNVLVTVSDLPLGVDVGNDGNVDYYMPDVKTTSDYEPFGAPLETRSLSENAAYLFGFNGQMKDDELHGEGNAYAFEYRIHDARIGRFLSVDSLAPEYPWNSTYAFAENRVIDGVDLEGSEYLGYKEAKIEFSGGILKVKISNVSIFYERDVQNGTRPSVLKQYSFVIHPKTTVQESSSSNDLRKPDMGIDDENSNANGGPKKIMYTVGSNSGGHGNKATKNVYINFNSDGIYHSKLKYKGAIPRGTPYVLDLLIEGLQHMENIFLGNDNVDIYNQIRAADYTIQTMKQAVENGMVPEFFMNTTDLSNIANVVLQGQLSMPMDPDAVTTLVNLNTGEEITVTGQQYNAIIYKLGMDIYNTFNPPESGSKASSGVSSGVSNNK